MIIRGHYIIGPGSANEKRGLMRTRFHGTQGLATPVQIIDPARSFLNEDRLYRLLGIRDEPGVPGQ